MFLPLMLLALGAGASVLWLIAAFVLRLGHSSRLVVTLGGPALIVGVGFWLSYIERRTPNTEPGWDLVIFVVSLFGGAFSGAAMLPIWFVAEETLGWRVRD